MPGENLRPGGEYPGGRRSLAGAVEGVGGVREVVPGGTPWNKGRAAAGNGLSIFPVSRLRITGWFFRCQQSVPLGIPPRERQWKSGNRRSAL